MAYSAQMTTQTVVDGMVVSIRYTLKLADGTLVEQSDEAFDYLHGAGNIVPGLEQALAGKSAGDHFDVTVAPDMAYGQHQTEGVHKANRSDFPPDLQIEPGMQFVTETEDGQQVPGVVAAVEGDEVTVDFNHPLAGQTLQFTIDVVGIRASTEEERQHGHPHSADGDACGHDH